MLAWNAADGTLGYYEVIATIHHTDQIVTELIIDGEWIETTPEHPFYVEGQGWVNAEDLQTGDRVRQADGTTGIVWLQWNIHKTQEMYNLTVDTAHTFFVGDGQWLVHNDCKWLGKGPAPEWGEEMAEMTDSIFSKLSPEVKNNSTLGLAQIGDQVHVGITARYPVRSQAVNELRNIVNRTPNMNYVANPSNTHIEQLLYNTFNRTYGFRGIAVSHWDGPCRNFCRPFFREVGFSNVFWTGIWK